LTFCVGGGWSWQDPQCTEPAGTHDQFQGFWTQSWRVEWPCRTTTDGMCQCYFHESEWKLEQKSVEICSRFYTTRLRRCKCDMTRAANSREILSTCIDGMIPGLSRDLIWTEYLPVMVCYQKSPGLVSLECHHHFPILPLYELHHYRRHNHHWKTCSTLIAN